MRKTTFYVIPSILAMISLHSCTSDLDLSKDITTEINFSSDGFSLAGDNSIDIPMDQILEIKDKIAVDEDSNYMFFLSKDMDTTKVNIGQGSLCGATEAFTEVDLKTDPSVVISNIKTKYGQEYGDMDFKSVVEPVFDGDYLQESISDLFYIYSPMTIDIETSFGEIGGVYNIDELKYEIPSFYDIEDESDLVENNISTTGGTHTHKIRIKGLNLSKTDLRPGEIATVDKKKHKIELKGVFTMTANAKSINVSQFKASESPMVRFDVFVGTLGTTHVVGKFHHKEDIQLNPITFDDLPSFLKDDSVVIDVENPQVHLTLDNEVPANVAMNARMTGYKNGTVMPNSHLSAGDEYGTDSIVFMGAKETTGSSKRTTVWITRIPTAIPDSVSRNVVIDSVTNLIRQIPDEIRIKATAKTDSSQIVELSLAHEYSAIPHYDIVAPLKIGKDMKIVYSKEIKDLHKTLKNFCATSFEINGYATNNVPLTLRFDITTYDQNGSKMDLVINKPDSISGYEKDMPINITMSNGDIYKLSDLDRIYIKIYSTTAEGMVGEYLNAKQNLKIEHLKATIKGEEE